MAETSVLAVRCLFPEFLQGAKVTQGSLHVLQEFKGRFRVPAALSPTEPEQSLMIEHHAGQSAGVLRQGCSEPNALTMLQWRCLSLL